MNVLCGVLNWNRSDNIVKKILNKIPCQYTSMLVTNNESIKANKVIISKAHESIAVSKNMILNYAKEHKFDYCIIIEDDVKIENTKVFGAYIDLLEKYQQPVVLYGMHNKNKVFNHPNPSVQVYQGDTELLWLNRFPCGAFMVFKVSDDMQMFDERLQQLETDYLLQDICKYNNKIKAGFYMDIVNSDKCFKRYDVPRERKSLPIFIKQDLEIRNERIKLENGADEILQYIKLINNNG